MKLLLDWRLLCMVLAGMTPANIARADDDPPKDVKKKQIVIIEKYSDDVLEKIKSQLEEANLSEEIRSDVLKKLEASLKAHEAATKGGKQENSKKSAKTEVASSKSDAKTQEEIRVTIVNGDDDKEPTIQLKGFSKFQGLGDRLKTQVIRPFGSSAESFRIGVACQHVSDDEGSDTKKKDDQPGLRIERVLEDSPAALAGIKQGDILLSANSKDIKVVADLTEAIQEAGKSDKDVTLEISRDDKKLSIQVRPKKMKTSDVEMDDINLNLNLPSGGFVLDEDSMKKWQEYAAKWKGVGGSGAAFAFPIPDSSDLKKEVAQLRSEVAELKKMIRELLDKK
ncbi:MAG: PDZ domain-containing protein [Pirellula sp.]